jgi:hypothetical protein
MSSYPYPPGPGTGVGTGLSDDALVVTESGADAAPATSGSIATGPTTSSTSTTDAAKDEAGGVADTATQAGRQVADTAKQQAGEVLGEARDQARSLLGRTRSEVGGQASSQQQRAAESLRSLSDELRSMASGQQEPGMATDLAHQAADKAGQLAAWLSDRGPGDILDEVSSFARRRPGTFLALAAGAGVVAGRLTRGMAAGAPSGHDAGTGPGSTYGRHMAGTSDSEGMDTTSRRPFTRATTGRSTYPDPDPLGTTGLAAPDTGLVSGTDVPPGNDVTR